MPTTLAPVALAVGAGDHHLRPVAILRGILDLYRDPGQLLDGVAAHEAGVPRRTASENHDAPDLLALPGREVEAVEAGVALLEQEAAPECAPDALGLLADLLQHEVGVAPQLDGLEIPVNVGHGADLFPGLHVDDPVALGGEHRDVALVEVDHRAGVLQDRRSIRGHEVLAVAQTEQHGRASTGHDDLAGVIMGHHGQSVCTLHVRQGRDHALLEVLPGRVLHQVGQYLGVGVGGELVARPVQPGAQDVGVLDDPVVDQGHRARAVRMRVGVSRRRGSVGGPARVGDAAGARGRGPLDALDEGAHSAGQLYDLEASAVLHHNTSRVVAPILEPAQSLEKQRHGRPRSHVPEDATHQSLSESEGTSSGRSSPPRPNRDNSDSLASIASSGSPGSTAAPHRAHTGPSRRSDSRDHQRSTTRSVSIRYFSCALQRRHRANCSLLVPRSPVSEVKFGAPDTSTP
jgi:hypothetical protein